jgi:formyl-CoA transferase
MSGEVPGQAGNDHPTSIPTGVFETADGHLNIGVSGQPMWRKFCVAIGAPELADHPDYATTVQRSRNRVALNAAINARTRGATSHEWVARLNEAGVPCGPIYRIDETFADPHVRHLEIAQPVASPVAGEITLVGQPIRLSRTPSRLATAAPERGDHTDEVLAELGFTAEQRDALRERKVI